MNEIETPAARPKLIYIVSPRYSGSTLLCYLLTTDPSVSTIGERKKFFNKMLGDRPPALRGRIVADDCSCGVPFKQCAYWQEIVRRIRKHLGPADLRRDFTQFQLSRHRKVNRLLQRVHEEAEIGWLPRSLIPWRARADRLVDLNDELIRTILAMDGNRVFVDSSKMSRHLLYMRHGTVADIHVVNLIRDPRAQVASAMKYNRWDAETAAKELMAEYSFNDRVLRSLGLPVLDVSYERLCADPIDVVSSIFAMVGIDVAPSLEFRRRERHIMGNVGTRFDGATAIQERVTWPETLGAAEISAIERVAAPIMVRMGIPPGPARPAVDRAA